ncbi:MAG: hypothetical protein ACOZB0_01430 [Pseudomonadota bacterium]
MGNWLCAVLACLALLVPAPVLRAGDIEGQKPVLFVADSFQFLPGAWARYAVRDGPTGEAYRLWIATLDKKSSGRKPSSWMEIEVESAETPPVVTRFLVRETPAGPGELLDVIVQMRGYAPFVVPEKYYRSEDGSKEVGQFQVARTLRRVAEASRVVAGREVPVVEVEAIDSQGRPMSAVVSTRVAPIGVIDAEAAGTRMTLEDWGDGATSRIEGKPLNFYYWIMRQIGVELFK